MNQLKNRRGEQGFTLVELAIVMIIIGLLIGGVLKGQELISNARVAAAVSKIKAIDAALSTFQDAYDGKPGDILNPGGRIPNCATGTICAQAPGVSDGRIGVAAGAVQATTSENMAAWAQLAAADMISGLQNGVPSTATPAAGVTNPDAELSGQLYLGYVGNGSLTGFAATAVAGLVPRAGHYLLVHNAVPTSGTSSLVAQAPTSATALGTASLTPGQASRIDQKMDDGQPNSGSVLAMGAAGATDFNCVDVATAAGIYNTAFQIASCGTYIRIQQ